MNLKEIGSYQIVESIAEGGMGLVYKAFNTQNKEVVAIKTLKDEVDSNSEAFLRFKKEAGLMATLDHENILKFIDFIEKENRLYIVTEYVQGKNLKQVIQEKTLSLDERVSLVYQIANALDYVHSKGIIHRDIKPSNIMVDADNNAKILDFGIANLMNFQKLFTNIAGISGSFAYMSPEQSGILKRNIDTRSDLYSLGILFYHLVTGELPYQAKEVGELLHQHIARTPEEPSKIVSGLSPIINKMILKLIKKDPDDRYQTAFGLAEDLNTYLNLSHTQKQNFYLELGRKDRLKNLNYRTRLIGRKKEMDHLLESLNQTILGKGSIAVVMGKSGMGKSRLLLELQKYTGSKNAFFIPVISGERNQNHPYYPFIEAVKSILDLLGKLPERRRNEIYQAIQKKLGKNGHVLAKIIPEIVEISGEYKKTRYSASKENEIFFEKLKDFFTSASSISHPLILSFDDVHFWDQGSILFYEYLRKYIKESSTFLILSLREEASFKSKELYEALKADAKSGTVQILNILSFNAEDMEDLVGEIFGTDFQGMSNVANRLYESTQGNPLLVIENIKTLVSEGILTQEGDEWQVDLEELSFFRFSSSIGDKILSRLLKISSGTKDVLSHAAVIGKDFNFSLLFSIIQKINPESTQEKLLDQLQEALQNGLIFETLSDKGEILYSFVHDKILETLISHMQEDKIKSIHRITAEIIEEHYNESDKVYKLAYHYLMGRNLERAYTYNEKAGKEALANFSFKLAVGFLINALNIIEQFDSQDKKHIQDRLGLGLEIARINFQLGEYQKNIELLEGLTTTAEENKSVKNLCEIYYLLGKNYSFSGNSAKAMGYYQKVIPIAEELGLKKLLAIPYCAIGRASCFMGYFKEALEYLKKGLDILPEDEILEKIYTLGVLGQTYAYMGHKEKALSCVTTLQESFGQTKNDMFELYSNFYTASILAMVGEVKKAQKKIEEVKVSAREQKNLAIELFSDYLKGVAAAASLLFEEGIKNMSKALKKAEEKNVSLGGFMMFYSLAELYAVLGNGKVAKETLIKAESYTKNANPALLEQWKYRILAMSEINSHIPDIYEAEEYAQKSLDVSISMGEPYKYVATRAKIMKAMVLWKMEKGQEAEGLYREALNTFAEYKMEQDVQLAEKLRSRFDSQSMLGKSFGDIESTQTFTMTATQTEFSYQRQLKYLLRLAEQLARVHQMEALLPKIMALAIEVSGAERGALYLFEDPDKPNSELKIQAQTSVEPQEINQAMTCSQTVLKQTIKYQKGQLIMDAESELPDDEDVQQCCMKSIITVPLITSGKLLGAIYLDNRQVKGLFTIENFELIKAFAIEAAISIENAKLYTQVQEQARVEQEMQIARDIQTSLLPFVKETEHYEISAFMQTATEVGGDYYDFSLEQSPYFGVFGDVSGHGLKSGLVMMMAEVAFNTMMKAPELREKALPELYQNINAALYENIQQRLSQKSIMGNEYNHMYMTFRMFRFDAEGHFEIFGNDHAEPFVCRQSDGAIESMKSSGFLLGILEDAMLENESTHFALESGDLFILYSDGITEAKSKTKEEGRGDMLEVMFGEERLFQVVRENRHLSPSEIIVKVNQEVDSWMAEQEDDITLVIIKKK